MRLFPLSFTAVALAGLAFLYVGAVAYAVEPDERLADPALELRARVISAELRCLVCQNQSIDDSSAPLARDLRMLVRERLTAGSSDAEIIRFLTDRYGEFVLLRPRFSVANSVLWLGPFVLLGAIVATLWRRYRTSAPRRETPDQSAPLSDEENKRLKRILSVKH